MWGDGAEVRMVGAPMSQVGVSELSPGWDGRWCREVWEIVDGSFPGAVCSPWDVVGGWELDPYGITARSRLKAAAAALASSCAGGWNVALASSGWSANA